jgi:hypothetical protein
MTNDEIHPVGSGLQDRLDVVSRTLEEIKGEFDPVAMSDGALIMTKRLADPTPVEHAEPARPSLGEIGSTGNSQLGGLAREDYNVSLQGLQGLETYDRMRKSDGQVRATLRLVKTPVLAARWYVEPGSYEGQTPQELETATEIARFVERNLLQLMTTSWPQLLSELLLMLDYGHYVFEKVFVPWNGQIIWKKFAPRHPMDIVEWQFDPNGGPTGIKMANPDTGDEYEIPIWKLAVFSYDMEAGNLQGVSALRAAYKHWFFKENLYKIDAIQKERHGVGVPVIVLPPNFTDTDKNLAQELGRNLRTNESAHIVVPPGWEIMFAELKGQPVDVMKSIEHHDLMISRNILGQFLNAPSGTSQEEQQELFLKATRYIADTARDVFNKYCIPQLVRWNFGDQEYYPELRVRRIGDAVDWRTVSFAIRNFVGAGVIIPDDRLEAWVRDEMDLPVADEATQRIIVAPQEEGEIPDGPPDSFPGPGDNTTAAARQNGGIGDSVRSQKAKLPRQSDAAGSTQGKTPGSSASGRDASGSGR